MKRTNLNPWDLLGLKPGASKEEIKEAFRRLAMQNHPDRGGDIEYFKLINNAYNKLKNDQMVPIVEAPKTKMVNIKLSIQQQIEGVDDYIETSTGEFIKVKIPPGASKDDKFKIKHNQSNIILNIKELSHPDFNRHGFSLVKYHEVSLEQALVGGELEVTGPCGEIILLDIPAGSCNNSYITVADKGLINKRTKKRGNLHVCIKVIMPVLDTEAEIEEFITRLTNVRNRKYRT